MLAIRNNYLHKRLPKYLLNLHLTAPTGSGTEAVLFSYSKTYNYLDINGMAGFQTPPAREELWYPKVSTYFWILL